MIFPRECAGASHTKRQRRQRDENERDTSLLFAGSFLLILRDLLCAFSLSLSSGRHAREEYLFGCHKLSLLCIISFCLDLAARASEEKRRNGCACVHSFTLTLANQKRMEFLTSAVPAAAEAATRTPVRPNTTSITMSDD